MSKVDLVRFLPTTDSEVLAKKINYQFEKQLITQLKGIERQEKFARLTIEKSNSVLKKDMMLKRQRSLPTSQNQGCLRRTENSAGESFFQVNRNTRSDEMNLYKQFSTDYLKRNNGKNGYVHRALSRSSSGGRAMRSMQPTAIPRRLTQSVDAGDVPTHGELVRVRSATSLDLNSRYNKWCESIDEMDHKKLSSSPPTITRPRSATAVDPEDLLIPELELEAQEMAESKAPVPRRPSSEKPPLRRQQRLCRVSSLPGSLAIACKIAEERELSQEDSKRVVPEKGQKTNRENSVGRIQLTNQTEQTFPSDIGTSHKHNIRPFRSPTEVKKDNLFPSVMSSSPKNGNGSPPLKVFDINNNDIEPLSVAKTTRDDFQGSKKRNTWHEADEILPQISKISKTKLRMTKSVQ
uniref:Uncharacterized protein n=1 Tax=Clytia hemisphaerica TaxID=252671 RepID=A0A7M5WHV4_9CNID